MRQQPGVERLLTALAEAGSFLAALVVGGQRLVWPRPLGVSLAGERRQAPGLARLVRLG